MQKNGQLQTAQARAVDASIITEELYRRAPRAPDLIGENRVLLKLANTLAQSPADLLQELVDNALRLCRAESAGLSLLDSDQAKPIQVRWVATTGVFAQLLGHTTPRDFSPCGTAVDAGSPLLISQPAQVFPCIEELPCPVEEMLLVPFYRGHEPVGTLWVVAHTTDCRFDLEDLRLVTNLSQFAAAAIQVIEAAEAKQRLEESSKMQAERDLDRLSHENRRIAALIAEQQRAEDTIRRELKDTRRLRDIAAQLISSDDASSLFQEILDAAIEITQADAGTIQLLDSKSKTLGFLASRNFSAEILEHFSRVDALSGSPCGVALSTGQRAFIEFDADAPDPDGSVKWHLDCGLKRAQSTPLVSRSGEPLGMFSTHWHNPRELTERELRFLDLLGRQAADLIERTQVLSALQASERELREGARRKDEFLAMLAHELRNPLVPIRNGVELLKRAKVQPELVEQVRPMMERQVVHMVRMIDDLLDVSRITSGKVVLKRETVSLSSLVGSAVETHRSAVTAAEMELQVDLHDPDFRLNVDPTRMSQVIANILHNATKFTPAGGRVVVRSQFEPEAEGRPAELVLRISDTGLGIPSEVLSNVFELFTQVRPDSSRRHGGMGIGLALSRRLVELHGGTITASSDGSEKGSEFTIRLPLTSAATRATASLTCAPQALAGLRVLVVDDNQDAADSCGLLVAQVGGEARVAYGAIQALEAVSEFDPAVVLLDIGMPEVDGYQACHMIRHVKGPSVRIIAVTGWGQEEDRRRALAAGFDAHLTKPVDFAQLSQMARG